MVDRNAVIARGRDRPAVKSRGAADNSGFRLICGLCGAAYTELSAFEEHQEKAGHWFCDACRSAISQHGSATELEKLHHRCRPYRCNLCNEGFANATQLAQHGEAEHSIKNAELEEVAASRPAAITESTADMADDGTEWEDEEAPHEIGDRTRRLRPLRLSSQGLAFSPLEATLEEVAEAHVPRLVCSAVEALPSDLSGYTLDFPDSSISQPSIGSSRVSSVEGGESLPSLPQSLLEVPSRSSTTSRDSLFELSVSRCGPRGEQSDLLDISSEEGGRELSHSKSSPTPRDCRSADLSTGTECDLSACYNAPSPLTNVIVAPLPRDSGSLIVRALRYILETVTLIALVCKNSGMRFLKHVVAVLNEEPRKPRPSITARSGLPATGLDFS